MSPPARAEDQPPGSDGSTEPLPRASARSLATLAVSTLLALLRGRGAGAALHAWVRALQRRNGTANPMLEVLGRRFVLVTEQRFSRHILAARPDARGYVAGGPKRSSMSFLAPHALTVSDGEAWQRRRAYNERILATSEAHRRAALLAAVRTAFARPAAGADEVRAGMREVMRRVVLGADAPASLAHDVDALMGVVQNPLRRALVGWRYRGRRQRFYRSLREQEASAPAGTLLADGRERGDLAPDEALEQVPHWMFPFAGSATDLLLRTLALVTVRPEAVRRIEDEVRAAGDLEDPGTIDRLAYLEACILEAGRLFPPVAVTFHTPPGGDVFEGRAIAPGTEVLHYFPLLERDTRSDADAHRFLPGRETADSNLFLSGARSCPGRELILFVLKAVLATLVVRHGIRVDAPTLAGDPLPLSFPQRDVRRFRTTRSTDRHTTTP